MLKIIVAIVLSVSVLSPASAQGPSVAVIPAPVSVSSGEGRFTLKPDAAIEIVSNDGRLAWIASDLSEKLSVPTGFPVEVKKVSAFTPGNIQLNLDESVEHAEGYKLEVTPSSVSITGGSPAGIFYGVQTLLQLFPPELLSKEAVRNAEWSAPAVRITDQPRFGWRGLMFDVSRHFFSVSDVKSFIDDMVRYKYNLLHLHLTDDQGWRIEIKSLPDLTKVGAWRPERKGYWGNTSKPSPDEPKNYGGFFTQDDIRDIVKYASERFVTILPEVDVPGHSLAAVASYPELSCTPGTYQVNASEKLINWVPGNFTGIVDNTLCPANEKVYEFLDKVFTEVAQLFPFEYIHMGGDECVKNFWQKSAAVKALMQREKLKDMHEVQSYFVKRVEKILKSKGKKLIGWDEILEGGLPADATVMSWRGMKGGIEAAKMGHKVIMSPSTHTYVDLCQGDPVAEPPSYSMLRLRDSYKFDPVPEGIDQNLILGGQANLWTEQIHNMRHAQYMLWPRGLAVAESVWSPPAQKDWNAFIGRVEKEFVRLDMAGVKYSTSMYDPVFTASRKGNDLQLSMETEVNGLDIHYSFDGSNPDDHYPKYSGPLSVPRDAKFVKVITYRNGEEMGKQINMPREELEKRAAKK